MIDHVSASVRIAMCWLRSAERISCTGNKCLLLGHGWRFPIEFPKPPGIWFRLPEQCRLFPRRASIGAHFHSNDFITACPGGAVNTHGGIRWDLVTLGRLGDLCLDLQFCDRTELSNVPSPFPVRIIQGLIIAGEWLVRDDDALQPFDRRHGVPAWHDRAYRKPVFWRKIVAVHSVGEQHIASSLLQRNGAGKPQLAWRTFRIIEHAMVRSFENDLACA